MTELEKPCLEWPGRKSKGYGVISNRQFEEIAVARIVWSQVNKKPIPTDMMVCHHCDNPPCIEPTHLFLGTAADNMRDKVLKGRARGGRKYLSDEQVQKIRELRPTTTITELGRVFGVSHTTISKICLGQRRTRDS